MNFIRILRPRCWFIFLLFGFFWIVAGKPISAQTCTDLEGFNVVYGISCSTGASPQGTYAMVDASQFASSSADICGAIRTILTSYAAYADPSQDGIVVDARGVNPDSTGQPCSDSPFDVTTEPDSSVILLPPGTIEICNTWAIPHNTRILGEGTNLTTLRAGTSANCQATGMNFSGDMIDMGDSTCGTFCPGIQIEHLSLNGANLATNGIVNASGQEQSYVNDVSFSNITGIGLEVSGNNAANSGPYTILSMSNVGQCVVVNNAPTDIRGIHGLTCSANGTPAISVNGSNTSLEDISINGSSADGILIGGTTSGTQASGIIIFNVVGNGVGNVVHISAGSVSGTNPPCPFTNDSTTTAYLECDITILSVTNLGTTGTNSIRDDVTNTTLSDPHVGAYILGEPLLQGIKHTSTSVGYARFTTSLHQQSWLVGAGTAIPSSCPANGSLYSYTGTSTGIYSIYECVGSSWSFIK